MGWTPTEAAFLPPTQSTLLNVTDYSEQVTMALSAARLRTSRKLRVSINASMTARLSQLATN